MADQGWEKIDPSKPQAKGEDQGWESIDPDTVDLDSVERLPTDVNPFLEGLLQGGSMGTSDEIQALMGLFSEKGYRGRWNELQKDIELARTTNPKMFYGGDIAGSLATSLIPGIGQIGAIGKAARYAKLAKNLSTMAKAKGYASQAANIAKAAAKAGAIQGAVSGYTRGGETGLGSLADIGLGGVLGGASGALAAPVTTAIGQGIVPAINVAKEKVVQPFLANPYVASAAKILPQYTKEVMQNIATYIKPQQTVLEAGKEFESKLNKFSSDLGIEREAARALLSDVPTIPAKAVIKDIENSLLDKGALFIKKQLQLNAPAPGAQGPTMKTIRKTIDSTKGIMPLVEKQKDLVKSLALEQGGKISEKQLREVILDNEIKGLTSWTTASGESQKPVAAAYNKAYGVLNERFPDLYKKAMEPVIEKTREASDLAKAFKFITQHGNPTFDDAGNFVANRHTLTDPTLSKLRGLPTKEVSKELLENFSNKYPNTDIGAMVRRNFIEAGPLTPKRPSFGTAIASIVNPMQLFGLGLLRDVAGPPIWRAAAVHSTPATTPGVDYFANALQKPMVNLFSQPNLYDTAGK